MSQTIEGRLDELGIELPAAAKSVANYLPVAQAGSIVLTSGQLPLAGGKLLAAGRLGSELETGAGALAAKQCALNVLAQAKGCLGNLERIARIVKITVFVASAAISRNNISSPTARLIFSSPSLARKASTRVPPSVWQRFR
ncbi:hypothetical protein MPLSOD_300009 [Mesorhizobium sp. SOD10]|nr:hypothetical protein MPLSOD_300009 [Mesorhizobium sp. SOD10]